MTDTPGPPRADPAARQTAGRGPDPAPPPAAPDRSWGPSALLRPEREIVPFGGRAAERAALRDWCAGLAPHSVLVLLGAAGVGKTRLARQAVVDWAAQAEPAQVVEPGDEPQAAAAGHAAGPGRPLLIVDEAESREGLAPLLDAVLTGPGEARVLLVARSQGDWWDLLIEDCPPAVARLLTEVPPLRLGRTLSPGVADADVAAAAVPHFAAAISVALRGNPEVERSALRLPALLLHAAALLAALRSAAGSPGPPRVVTGPFVLEELLEHELRYWRASAAAAGLAYDAERVTHAVTVLTLAGPRSAEEAEPLLARVPELTAETPERRVAWADWVSGLYPPGPNGRLGGLRPEPVAESLVVRQLAGDPVLSRRLLRALPPDQAVHAVALLARAGAHEPEAAGLLRAALHYDLAQLAAPAALVAQQVPGELPGLLRDALCHAPAAPQTLATIARGLPRPSLRIADAQLITILRARESLAAAGAAGLAEWDDLAAGVLAWLDGRDPARDEPEMAAAARWFRDPHGSSPPGPQGRGPRRFGAAWDAASQAREGQAELASALTNLAVRSYERDRPQDARRAEEQAVRIYRQLAAAEPQTYRPELAAGLANLAVWLAEVSTPDDAVPLTREAADLLRELAAADPPQFQPDLATCLANLSIWYTRAGQPADALAAEQEAAGILRELALADPGQFRAELAASLTNLGICYARAGRGAEAVPAEQEAVALRRELAAVNPGQHGADLASALTNLAITQAELGRVAEASAAAQDAVTVYRELAAVDPGRHERGLARALSNLGARRRELHDHEGAAEALSEAVSIQRTLVAADPGRDRAGLARTLASLSAVLAELGRQDEARAARAEAGALGAEPGSSAGAVAGPVPAERDAPPMTAARHAADAAAQAPSAGPAPSPSAPAKPQHSPGTRKRSASTRKRSAAPQRPSPTPEPEPSAASRQSPSPSAASEPSATAPPGPSLPAEIERSAGTRKRSASTRKRSAAPQRPSPTPEPEPSAASRQSPSPAAETPAPVSGPAAGPAPGRGRKRSSRQGRTPAAGS